MAKRMIYFRGHCYEDTLRNRVVAYILTFSYKLLSFLRSLWILFVFILFGCNSGSPVEKQETVSTDSLYIDSLRINDHSYIYCYDNNGISIIHNPDCHCRYNRTFIVVKRNK